MVNLKDEMLMFLFQMVSVLSNHEYTIYFCILNVSTLPKLVHTFCVNSSASDSF
jgi:hypothetical protein